MAPFGTAPSVARFMLKGKPDPAWKSRIFKRLTQFRVRAGSSVTVVGVTRIDFPEPFVLVERGGPMLANRREI